MFVKLENNTLVYPPKNKGNILNYDVAEEFLIADGYKVLIEGIKEEGKKYHESYEETDDAIIQIFTEYTQEEYEEEARKKAQEERLRKDSMSLTPSDVERVLYYGLEMDFDDLKALIKNAIPTIDLKGLAIEFRAKDFYRGAVDKDKNRIVDMIGLFLGLSSEDLDYLFEHKQLSPEAAEKARRHLHPEENLAIEESEPNEGEDGEPEVEEEIEE